jgi:hypothetical protein
MGTSPTDQGIDRNVLGKCAAFVFRPPPPPKDLDQLLAEPILYSARREAFEWANNHTFSFTAILVVTTAFGVGIAALVRPGVVAVIVGGLLGLGLAMAILLALEAVYKTPRRKLELAMRRVTQLEEAAKGREGIPQIELHAVEQLFAQARKLEDRWANSVPVNATCDHADEDFARWCTDVLTLIARLRVHQLHYTEFENLTPMRHAMNRGGHNRLELVMMDLRTRHDWLLDFIKRLEAKGGA